MQEHSILQISTIAKTWHPPAMPEWVFEEMKALVNIEPELLPPDDSISKYEYYSVPKDSEPGRVYKELIHAIGIEPVSHIILAPWLKAGGADRGIIYHARAILEINPRAGVLVIVTENSHSPWQNRLPDSVRFVEFGILARDLEFNKQVSVLTRLLVQLNPSVIHIINSRVGWEAVRKHGLALTQESRLFASLFCDDYTPRMVPVGFARDYLRDCVQWLDYVFSDNSEAIRKWHHELGVPIEKMKVVSFPYDREISALKPMQVGQNFNRVLWAGRLDRQKRPDILAAIARAAPGLVFDVYGTSVTGDSDAATKILEMLPNVILHGEFSRLEDIVSDEHFAYLHTTAWEGVPTILFDVAAAGLPICAPAVGGIPDFLSRDDLIDLFDDVTSYVRDLQSLLVSPELREMRRNRQWAKLFESRQWPMFIARMRMIPGYTSISKIEVGENR